MILSILPEKVIKGPISSHFGGKPGDSGGLPPLDLRGGVK
jgi:hypothetical protein